MLRVSSQDREHVVAVCRALLPMFEAENVVGALWIVEDERVRIWKRSPWR